MVPDFKASKHLIEKQINNFFRQAMQKHMRSVSPNTKMVFEGHRHAAHYGNDVVYESELKSLKSEINITLEEILGDTDLLFSKLESMVADMADQQLVSMFSTISEITEATGQVVTGKMTPEILFETYEKVEMDCDENGELKIPAIHAGTDMIEEVKKIFEEIKSDKKLTDRFNKIFEKKKQDYIDRENNRKLVD